MTGRDNDATWRRLGTLCRKRDWSLHRLIRELQDGLRYRTIPEGHVIDWHDPEVLRTLNVEASEVTITLASGVSAWDSGDLAFGMWHDRLIVGIEVAEARRMRRRVLRRHLVAAGAAAGVGAASAAGQSFFAAVGSANGSGTAMAVPEAAGILPTGKWLAVTARRLRDEKKIAEDIEKKDLAEVLAAESKSAVKTGQLGRTLEASYLKKLLKPLGIWPLSSLK